MRSRAASERKSTTAAVLILGLLVGPVTLPAAAAQEPEPGTPPAREIVVSLADRQLALVEGGVPVLIYSIAVGAPESPTPAGEFRIINRIVRPTYYRPSVVIRPGPANPLGSRWLGLDRKGYGIHGTNEPGSIGRAVSAGCIRMHNRDVEELFERVRPGDRVRLVSERTEELAALFGTPGDGRPAAEPAAGLAAAATHILPAAAPRR